MHYALMQAACWKPLVRVLVAVWTGSFFPMRGAAANPSPAHLAGDASQRVDFATEIQPILSNSCFECHGELKQKGGLRLDEKTMALKGGDTGPLLVAGKSSESLLILAVTGAKEDLARMPKKRDPLTPEQIGRLRAWIDQGADWPETSIAANRKDWRKHWSFKPPVRPKLPQVQNTRWPRNPIDAFVLARLEREGLAPSAEADKIALLRRLSLDLIGLPPTISEVDAFLADRSDAAYEKEVERLLASPHYGERWGRQWLDAARYADSDGFEKDKPRTVWFYRDWVIQALNRDLPYDQFVIDQIAGDELPNATQDEIVATGFLRNSMINEEGGIEPEQFRMDAMFDRMDCIGKSVLGITIQCAQCHDHKFDPLKQAEYYRLFAFLNNDHEAQRVVYTPDEIMKVANLSRQMREIEARLRHATPGWQQRMNQWEKSIATQPEWTVLRPTVEDISTGGQRYLPQSDGSFLALGYAPTKHTGKFWITNDLQNISAFRLELLTDPNLPCDGPGRSFKGTCALTEFKVEAIDASNPTNKVEVKFTRATADFDQPEAPLEPNFEDKSGRRRVTGPAEFAIDGKDETAWGIDAGPGRRNQPRHAVFECSTPVGFPGGTILVFHPTQNHGGWNSDDIMNNNLGRFRFSATTNTGPIKADTVPALVREVLAITPERRSPAQVEAVFSYWRSTVPEYKQANDQIEALWKEWPSGATALTLMAREQPRDTHILKRGDWLKPTDQVAIGVPAFLHPLEADMATKEKADALTRVASGVSPDVEGGVPPPGTRRSQFHGPTPQGKMPSSTAGETPTATARLALAHWLVDKKSPTTARVVVNRLWQAYFGTGLVSTPEDFGMQSEPPSHPELLDWLARELMEPTSDNEVRNSALALGTRPAWGLKHIHRLIVTSAAYRQGSKVSPDLYARDPANRLLARGPRLRVDAEIVRDIALSASGLLNDKIGGPSIFSPAPEFLFQPPASYAPFPWKEETGPDRYRRALYTFRRRSTPYPVLQVFDAPNGDSSCVRRLRSNTPLQALAALNETVFVECAQALARKTLAEGGHTDVDRLTYAFRCALSRVPKADEKAELIALLEKEKTRIAEGWVNANEIATGKDEPPADVPRGATPTQLAAYTVVSRVLLNLDETITKE